MFRPQFAEMSKTDLMIPLLLFLGHLVFAQDPTLQDSSLNNLVHPAGYKACQVGELGRVTKKGKGKQSMILIPGLGFGGDIYADFIKRYKNEYTIYTITPAGFEGTPAPPMPNASIPYSSMSWTEGIMNGIVNLIEKEKLDKPVVVAHFVTATQVALDLAHDHPDLISAVIIIGGSPFRYFPSQRMDGSWSDWEHEQKYTSVQREKVVEYYWAQQWFKTVKKKIWDDNMWTPDDYSKDKNTGADLFNISAHVPIQIMIRYLLEWMAYDPNEKYGGIHIPVLILMPDFKELLIYNASDTISCKSYVAKQYLKYFHQLSWQNAMDSGNPLFTFKTVPDSRIFTWIDNPDDSYTFVDEFLRSNLKLIESVHRQ